jgi:hypothetical protein
MDADEVEQRIIRAYVQLACTPAETDGSRTVAVTRLSGLEVRLTEVPLREAAPGMPQFWLEVYSHASRSVIDSCGCREFDERELAAAVEMVTNSLNRNRPTH